MSISKCVGWGGKERVEARLGFPILVRPFVISRKIIIVYKKQRRLLEQKSSPPWDSVSLFEKKNCVSLVNPFPAVRFFGTGILL